MQPWLLVHQQVYSDQYRRDILPHAIIVNGVAGSGKLDFALWLIQLLSCQQPQEMMLEQGVAKHAVLQYCGDCKCCMLMRSHTYPDYLNLVAEKNSLGIDEIRDANVFLQKKSHLGKFKTVLIENAQTMTTAAANALLKTLEEPSENSVIILLTSDIDILLPTIVSRCRVLNIRPNVGEALLQNISRKLVDNTNGSDELAQQFNNPFINITQLPELTDNAIYQAYEHFKASYYNFLGGQQTEFQLLEQLLQDENGLRWLEQLTVNLLRNQYIHPPGELSFPLLSSELLNNIYKLIINACKVMKSYTQANKQFVCEQLIQNISNKIEQAKTNEQEI